MARNRDAHRDVPGRGKRDGLMDGIALGIANGTGMGIMVVIVRDIGIAIKHGHGVENRDVSRVGHRDEHWNWNRAEQLLRDQLVKNNVVLSENQFFKVKC